jgi:hypothetical protein
MRSLALVVLCVMSVGVALAHVCTMSPPQRGGPVDLTQASDPRCWLIEGPCGNMKPERPQVQYQAGQNFTVVLQKNLDHYQANNPGEFLISFAMSPGAPFSPIGFIMDTTAPSLSIYSITVVAPMTVTTMGVLQVDYNAHVPHHFYQCSDIAIVPATGDGDEDN